jgi:hypothetical protein
MNRAAHYNRYTTNIAYIIEWMVEKKGGERLIQLLP